MEKVIGLVLGAVMIVALAGMLLSSPPTGAAGIPFKNPLAPAESYKIEIVDHVKSFFGTDLFVFPNEPCAMVAEKMFNQMYSWETAKIETFSAGNSNRFLTIIFEEDKKLGKMTLVKGFDYPEAVQLHMTISKTVISISDWQEVMELDIELNGKQEGDIIAIAQGRMSVLDFACSFGY